MELSFYLFYLLVTMINIASLNSQGLRSSDRRQTAFSFFRRNRLDIILLQETHWTVDLDIQIKHEWDGEVFFNHGTNTARGVAILINPRLDCIVRQIKRDNHGRILNILLEMDDCTFNMVNIYAPRTDNERQTFFVKLDDFISTEHENIIGGDFNCIANQRLDKCGGNPNARHLAAGTLQAICTQFNLTDVWRDRHKDKRNYTWTGRHPINGSFIRTRIDKFIISRTINHFVTDTSIKSYMHSDHDYVSLTLNLENIKRGLGFWHFNNELLADAAFEAEIKDFWTVWQTKYDDFADPLVWWDKAKNNFKTIAIRCAKIRGKAKRYERSQLEDKLGKLQQKAASGTTRDIEQYLLAKETLKKLDLKDLEAIKIRAKAQFLEEGEKSTRYFYSLEKSRKADQTIRVLTKDNLDVVSEPQDLLKETHNFYKQLFTAQPIDVQARDKFLNCTIPKLSDDARESCEGLITEEELRKAVMAMENNKSPGCDGLTSNFYKKFWPILGERLSRVYNYAFNNGLLTVSQRRGIITLLFKKGDRTQLKNWRPVTLLNTDYKILTKALANRLQQVLPLIVNSGQTACIKGRTINDNTRLLNDVISYVNEKNTSLAFISIDQMKAFDRVSHDFLFACLERFGFGPNFINWIKLIYHDASSSVKTNGWLTAFIKLERGLRQGCALSMPLYVLTAETMAINIRENPRIHRIRPPGSEEELKLSQYADDTTLLLSDDVSINEAFTTFDLYERASGARINKGKCKGLWCGAFRGRSDQLHGFQWFNDYIPEKILGLFFGNVDCTRINWDVKIQKINHTIAAWRHRDLSYKGKALVVNGLLASTLWYNATSLPMPAWAISQIEQSLYDFFWNYKRHLTTKDILSLPLKEGGFNIPRLGTKILSLRMNTLRRLLSEDKAHWKHFTSYFLRISNMHLGKMSLALDYSLQRIDRDIPGFHRELLTAWHRHRDHHVRTRSPESLITTDDKPLIFTDWIAAGITRIKDICYEVIPGYLSVLAMHDMLTDSNPRTLAKTSQGLRELFSAFPPHWSHMICTESVWPPPSLQPCFGIVNSSPGSTPIDITLCRTRHFYGELLQAEKPVIPALDYWRQNLHPEPSFNAKQWKTMYPALINNKHGDITWKIAHRVLSTALSLNRIVVYATPYCHRCGETDTIEHAILNCPSVNTFWNLIQAYISKITDQKLTLSSQIKLFGKVKTRNGPFPQNSLDLVNWTLTLARWAIHKSAVNYRVKDLTVSPEALFKAMVRSHLRLQYKLYNLRQTQYYFPHHWFLGEAFAKVQNDTLIFTL